MLVVTAFVSLGLALSLVLTARLHGHLTFDHAEQGVQKVHTLPVPRIGGVAVAGALLAGGFLVSGTETGNERDDFDSLFGMIMLAAIPAFIAGLLEDITKRVGVMSRLMATMASGVVFALLSGIWLDRLDIPLIDGLLPIAVIGIAVTAFALAGVANSINIIDGFNGLAGGVSIIILLGIAAIAQMVGDVALVRLALIGATALFGFMLVNYPRGLLFLGDGGAYVVGYYLAQLAVLLVVRNPEISPWAMAVLFCYPLTETTFSIIRRVRNNRHPGHPDRIHLHSLIHGRIVRKLVASDSPLWLSNALVAPIVWLFALVPALLAVQWAQDAGALIVIAAGFCFAYNFVYTRLARFRWCLRCALGIGLRWSRRCQSR